MLEIKIGEKSFVLSDEEQKAAEYVMVDIFSWVENVIKNRSRQAIDQIVEEQTDRRAKKVPIVEKLTIVKEAKIKSAKQRNEEMENDEKLGR